MHATQHQHAEGEYLDEENVVRQIAETQNLLHVNQNHMSYGKIYAEQKTKKR